MNLFETTAHAAEFVKVQVGDSVEMRIQKTSVGATLPKGTIKSLD